VRNEIRYKCAIDECARDRPRMGITRECEVGLLLINGSGMSECEIWILDLHITEWLFAMRLLTLLVI